MPNHHYHLINEHLGNYQLLCADHWPSVMHFPAIITFRVVPAGRQILPGYALWIIGLLLLFLQNWWE